MVLGCQRHLQHQFLFSPRLAVFEKNISPGRGSCTVACSRESRSLLFYKANSSRAAFNPATYDIAPLIPFDDFYDSPFVQTPYFENLIELVKVLNLKPQPA